MAHDHAAPPSLDVDGLGDVVHDVRVHDGRVAHQDVRVVKRPQAALLAGRPLLRAVGAEVHDGAGLELLACPQVGGHVEVVQRHLGVVKQFLLVVLPGGALAAHGLRQHHELAQLHARDHEAGHTVLPGDPDALVGRAPELGHGLAHLGRQRGKPALVVGQWQKVPVHRLHEFRQRAGAVARSQHLAHGGNDVLLARAVKGITLGLELRHQVLDGTRHVQVGGALVLFPRRVVPEKQRHLLVGVGRGLQARQVHGLAHQHVHLLGHGHQLAAFVGGQHHRVLQADVLGVRQRERQVEAVHAHRVLVVLGTRAAAVGEHVDDRHPHGLVPGLARLGVHAQEGVDQQHLRQDLALVGDERFVHGHGGEFPGIGKASALLCHRRRPAAPRRSRAPAATAARRTAGGFGLARGRSLTRCAGHARAAVEHQWQGTGLLDGLHGLVQHALLAVGDVAGRHLDADHRQALPGAPRPGLPPRQVLRQLLEHQPVVAGVVDAAIGQRQRWCDGAQVAALEGGPQVLEQPLVVDARAAHVVVEHALRLLLVHVDGAQAHRRTHDVDAGGGQAQLAQPLAGHALDLRLIVTARCVDQHKTRAFEHTPRAGLALGVHLRPRELDALFPGHRFHELELALQHELCGEDGHLVRGLRPGPHQRQQGAQEETCHLRIP